MKRLASKEARLGRGRSVALFYEEPAWERSAALFYEELERKPGTAPRRYYEETSQPLERKRAALL